MNELNKILNEAMKPSQRDIDRKHLIEKCNAGRVPLVVLRKQARRLKMGMTKKQFEELAEIVKSWAEIANKGDAIAGDTTARAGVNGMAHQIADFCDNNSKSFDRQRFLKACGVLE